MSLSHRTVRSPDPSRRSLVVAVGETSLVTTGGIIPPHGTNYFSQIWKGLFTWDYSPKFKEFNYVEQLDDIVVGGLRYGQLLFARPPAKSDDGTPIPFRTFTHFGNHYWHTILLELKPILVHGFPLATQVGTSTVNADRYVMRERYIPAATEGTRFQVDEFFGDQQFNIPKSPVPIASAVTYDIVNRRGGFPECIHDRLIIQSVQGLPQQIFPSTDPFTEWVPYVISDDQELTSAGWYRKRIRVFPPAIPYEVIRKV